jgi:hypothetical protein
MKTQRLLGLIVLLAGCPAVEKSGDVTGGGSVPAAVQARFDMYCLNNQTCHVSGGAQGPDLSASGSAQGIQGTAANGMRFVVFGDVENSWLAQKLLPGTPGQMPPIGNPQPTPEDVAIIIGWIGGAPFPEEETDSATGMMTMSTSMTMTDTSEESSSGGEELLSCSLESVDASVDPGMAVDAGDAADQVPMVVADALIRNCGCHYTDTIPMEYGAPYPGTQPMSTIADFQGEWLGGIPANTGQMAYEAIAERIAGTLVMPPNVCGPDGEPAAENPTMTQEDYDLLQDWLGMGAPDGATYVPP